MVTIGDLISLGRGILQSGGDECFETDAEVLMCHVLGIDRPKLFLNRSVETDSAERALYEALANRVAAGEPLQYVTGEAYFMGHRFAVSPAVLIPRPETEILCETAIRELRARAESGESPTPAVLDLCTGSGALAISIALAVPAASLTASDISQAALDVARTNASALGVSSRIDFTESDLFDGLGLIRGNGGRYDMIVTNPPYIPTGDISGLPREVRCHEPSLALDGGESGLDFYHRIAEAAKDFLTDGGILLAEIGYDQGENIKAVLKTAGFSDISVSKDLAGRDRVVRARRP